MTDFIVIAVIAALVGAALWYIRREKQKGSPCIGCSACSGCCSGCGGCSNHE